MNTNFPWVRNMDGQDQVSLDGENWTNMSTDDYPQWQSGNTAYIPDASSNNSILTKDILDKLGSQIIGSTGQDRPYHKAPVMEDSIKRKIAQCEDFIKRATKILQEYESMKYSLGEVVIHKENGKGIIVERFHEDLPEDNINYGMKNSFTGYVVMGVKILNGEAVCSTFKVRENELAPYSTNAEALFGSKS